jgi:hypothetical protein
MAGASSPIPRQQRLQQGFEFSRLHEEWMASVYALVVPGRSASRRQQASCGPGRAGASRLQELADHAKRRAG